VTTLREFKAKYLTKLLNIKKQLIEKYPEKRERVEYVVDLLVAKLENLRVFALTDYIATLYQATKEFRELEQLIPSEKEIEELVEGE
jgi:2-hydroxy-3-keto-5-methylthiopentenyl-1-phosphate phosphatase